MLRKNLGLSLVLALVLLASVGVTAVSESSSDLNSGTPTGAAGPLAPPILFTSAWAVVNANGSLARQSGDVVSTARLTVGQYEVIFDDEVTECVYTASLGLSGSLGIGPAGEIEVVGRFLNVNGVFVSTHTSTGAFADRGFHLLVSC